MIKNVFITNHFNVNSSIKFDYSVNVNFPVKRIKASLMLIYDQPTNITQNQFGILRMFGNDLAISQTNWGYSSSGAQVYETTFEPHINVSGKYEVQIIDPVSLDFFSVKVSGMNIMVSLTFLG